MMRYLDKTNIILGIQGSEEYSIFSILLLIYTHTLRESGCFRHICKAACASLERLYMLN